MQFFVQDMVGYILATIAGMALVVVPGFGLVTLLRKAGAGLGTDHPGSAWALVLSLALLPALDALLLRFGGMPAVLMFHLALAVAGAAPFFRWLRAVDPRWHLAVLAWWLVVAAANVDFDWAGRLHQSLTVLDMVKHASVVTMIAHHGLPLVDPFFAREGAAGYYYYFYILPGLIHWLGLELIDPRAAFMAAGFVTGLAFPALLLLLGRASGLVDGANQRRFLPLLVLLCCISGLDILPALLLAFKSNVTLSQLDWWGEEVRWGLTSIIWVPHHIAALVALLTGCLLLVERRDRKASVALVGAASLAFATSFGSSVWITLAGAPVLAIWWLASLKSSPALRWSLPAAGLAALLIAAFQVHDLLIGRAISAAPLEFYLRSFGPATEIGSLPEALLRLIMLPVGYGLDFGLFALGAVAFLASGRARSSWNNETGRLLMIGGAVSLLLAAFVRSSVINNDFGWRAIWFAQVPALLWTAVLLTDERTMLRRGAWRAALALGLAATLWDLAGLRFVRPPHFRTHLAYINQFPDVDYDLRRAYAALARRAPPEAMIQHHPSRFRRAFAFGLYGHHRVAVADAEAHLFGADASTVTARVAALTPPFDGRQDAGEPSRRAAIAGIDYLVITRLDPAWAVAGGPPAGCLLRFRHVCVKSPGQEAPAL